MSRNSNDLLLIKTDRQQFQFRKLSSTPCPHENIPTQILLEILGIFQMISSTVSEFSHQPLITAITT